MERVVQKRVVTCTASDSLRHVAGLMWRESCSCVFVVDDDGRATAMLTDADISTAAFPDVEAFEQLSAADIGSRSFVTVDRDADLEALRRRMNHGRLRHIAVVDDAGRPLGFASIELVERELDRRQCGSACSCAGDGRAAELGPR
jgi:CBS domain-containing protein